MDIYKISTISFILLLASEWASAVKECYSCDSNGDPKYGSVTACSAEYPVTSKLNRLKFPDVTECHMCTKGIVQLGNVQRGCISEQEYDEIAHYFQYGEGCVSSMMPTGQNSDSTYEEYCVCSLSRCNSGNRIVLSSFAILATVFTLLTMLKLLLP